LKCGNKYPQSKSTIGKYMASTERGNTMDGRKKGEFPEKKKTPRGKRQLFLIKKHEFNKGKGKERSFNSYGLEIEKETESSDKVAFYNPHLGMGGK